MTEDTDREDRIILALLEASGEETEPDSLGRLQEGSAEGRAYTELLGLIPRALPAESPPPGVKRRLTAVLAAGRAPDAESSPGADVLPLRTEPPRGNAQTRAVADRAARRTARRVAAETAAGGHRFRAFLVAAVIAFLMVGVSGWFYVQLRQQRETVARLQTELEETILRLEELDDGRRDVVASLRDVGLMPSDPVNWCPLRPPEEAPPQPDAHGSLLLVMEHGRWSVRIHNLEPAAADKIYVLWFLEEDAPLKKVNLGRGDRPVQISATGIPMVMTAAAVTLESSMDAEEPSGPRILYGHRRDMDRL